MSTPGPTLGPCSSWVSAADVAAVCAGADPADPVVVAAAVNASQILFEKSGRQFSGLCGPVTVRPCKDVCGCWGGNYQFGGYTWVWLSWQGAYGWSNEQGGTCGCGYISRVKLGDYPVREIVEVKIDGAVLPLTYEDGPPTYRLDKWRFLTRMDNPAQPDVQAMWPQCQNLTLDDTQNGTFSITYTYGVDPPVGGMQAAAQLACQLSLALSGKACQLPAGAATITKNGVTINRGLLATWGYDPKKGWATGLALVDAFLNTWNPAGLRRRGAIWTPDISRYATRLGEQS